MIEIECPACGKTVKPQQLNDSDNYDTENYDGEILCRECNSRLYVKLVKGKVQKNKVVEKNALPPTICFVPAKDALKERGIKGVRLDNLKVNCYSGYTYAERPKSFLWEGVEYEIEEIEKEWLEPGEKHFQVRTRDNKLFQLCYNETEKQWSLTEPVGG